MEHWVRVMLQDVLFVHDNTPDYVHKGLARAARLVEEMEPYQFRTDSFDEIADALSECTDLPDLSRLMWSAATEAGFENFIIFVIKNGADGALQSRVCTSCNADWVGSCRGGGGNLRAA